MAGFADSSTRNAASLSIYAYYYYYGTTCLYRVQPICNIYTRIMEDQVCDLGNVLQDAAAKCSSLRLMAAATAAPSNTITGGPAGRKFLCKPALMFRIRPSPRRLTHSSTKQAQEDDSVTHSLLHQASPRRRLTPPPSKHTKTTHSFLHQASPRRRLTHSLLHQTQSPC
jgi:hypothetical protein